jgi:hypothetical protein
MSTALSTRHPSDLVPADPPPSQLAGAIVGALDALRAIRTFIKEEFVEGTDYGKIKGCGDKDTLFLPGAQKAVMYFNCYPTYKVKEKDLGEGHVEYRVRTLLISRVTGQQIGEGIGCASTREKKFKRGAGGTSLKKCPACGKLNIRKSKDKPEYYCWRKEGGCGGIFPLRHPELQEAPIEVENEAPYEVRNTVLKMGKKRSLVDGSITLGCLSELFTQDIEDTYDPVDVRMAGRHVEVIDGETVINGEVIEPEPPKAAPSARGLFTNDHVARTKEFVAWLSEQCRKINEAWNREWKVPLEEALEAGHSIPDKIPDVINPWQAKKHLLKWAVETERLDPTIVPENAQSRQDEAYVALVWHRSREDRKAIKDEMAEYLKQQRRIRCDVIYRKHPEMAPSDWAEAHGEVPGQEADVMVPDGADNTPEPPWQEGRE